MPVSVIVLFFLCFTIENFLNRSGQSLHAIEGIGRVKFFIKLQALFEGLQLLDKPGPGPHCRIHLATGAESLGESRAPLFPIFLLPALVKAALAAAMVFAYFPKGVFAAFIFAPHLQPIHAALLRGGPGSARPVMAREPAFSLPPALDGAFIDAMLKGNSGKRINTRLIGCADCSPVDCSSGIIIHIASVPD